jgi:hypothetical protein
MPWPKGKLARMFFAKSIALTRKYTGSITRQHRDSLALLVGIRGVPSKCAMLDHKKSESQLVLHSIQTNNLDQ